MSTAQDAYFSICGVRLRGWVGCGAQGGYKGCVWRGGLEVCIHYMLCDLGCTWWRGDAVHLCSGAGGAEEHMRCEGHCARRIGLQGELARI